VKHLLSFDLEEWFHIIDNDAKAVRPETWESRPRRIEVMTDKLLRFLRERKAKATFFSLGWVAEKYPHLLARIAADGHEVGCHSQLHRPVWSLSPEAFAEDLRVALDAIEKACGVRPKAFRAPGFSIDGRALWAFDALAREGIELDSSIYPGRHNHGGIPGAPARPFRIRTSSGAVIREFPISTCSLLGKRVTFSGGGYFRILPLALQRRRFRDFDREGNPVVTYFHPRDFDTEIPDSGLGWLRELKSKINVGGAFSKLSTLIGEFEMAPLSGVDASVNWQVAESYSPEELGNLGR
jgi:polysaccharide deacetylase family protein (PEP-CTERM system associated)